MIDHTLTFTTPPPPQNKKQKNFRFLIVYNLTENGF